MPIWSRSLIFDDNQTLGFLVRAELFEADHILDLSTDSDYRKLLKNLNRHSNARRT